MLPVSREQLQQVVGSPDARPEFPAAGVMRLVHEHEVPFGLQHFGPPVLSLGKLAGRDQVIRLPPRGAGDLGFAAMNVDQRPAFVAGQVQRALLPEFLLPLPHDAGGGEDQRPADPSGDDELA